MYAIIFSAFFYWLNLTVRFNIGIKTDNRSFITLVSFIASLVGVFCGPSVYDFFCLNRKPLFCLLMNTMSKTQYWVAYGSSGMSVLVTLTQYVSREGNTRSPQAFHQAALYCTVITHPDPHHPSANQRALPVSLSKYLVHNSTSLSVFWNILSYLEI